MSDTTFRPDRSTQAQRSSAAQNAASSDDSLLLNTRTASADARCSIAKPPAIKSSATTAHMNQAISHTDPVIAFAKTLAELCDVEIDTPDERAFLQQLQYWFNQGAEIPSCQFLGLNFSLKINNTPLDKLDVKSAASQEKLDKELTKTLLSCCNQAKITDARRDFIHSRKYLEKLRDSDVTTADIHVLRRLCPSPPAGFDVIAFIQQFTDASRGSAGQCGAQESLQMHRTLLRASTGYFHQIQISEQGLTTSDLIAETKLAVWNYCERLIHQAMQAAGQSSENRRYFEGYFNALCAQGVVTIGQQIARINPIAMAHEVVIRINQLMDRDRVQTPAILAAMKILPQDVLLTNADNSIGKVLCEKGAIAHISFLQPTTRSIVQWLSTCGIVQLQAPARNAEKNYAHLADLFHQLNALEAEGQKRCYAALSAIPALQPSPLLWALKAGDSRLLETLVRIAGEAVYQPIEEKTLLQHALSGHNQELFDGLNRVLADKDYLAAELHQLFSQPASAARNRKILMFSEASWLKESKYKELRLKIIKLQQSMRAGYIQRQRTPHEINRVLIAALMENDQDQVDLLLEEIQERNITFDATQMTEAVLNQLGHERAQRILGFMQTRQIRLNDFVVNTHLVRNSGDFSRLKILIKFAIDHQIQINTAQLSQPFTQALCACLMKADEATAQRMAEFAKAHHINLSNADFTQSIVNCFARSDQVGIARLMFVFAKKNQIVFDVKVFTQGISGELSRITSYGSSGKDYMTTVQQKIIFARENEIQLDKVSLSQSWSTAVSNILRGYGSDKIITAQQAAEFAVQNHIPVNAETLARPWTQAIADCFMKTDEATAQRMAEFAKAHHINLSNADFTQSIVNSFARSDQVGIARLMFVFAKKNQIVFDEKVFSQGVSARLALIQSYGSSGKDHIITAQQMVIFSGENKIQLDRAALSQSWSTAVSNILRGYGSDKIITAQQAANFAVHNQIQLDSSILSRAWTLAIAACFMMTRQENNQRIRAPDMRKIQQMAQFAEDHAIALNNDALTESILFCLSAHYVMGLQKTWSGIRIGKAIAREILHFAKTKSLIPNVKLFTQDIQANLSRTKTLQRQRPGFLAELFSLKEPYQVPDPDVITASHLFIFSMENNLPIETTVAQSWTSALSHLLNSRNIDNIVCAQKAAEFAEQQHVHLELELLAAPWARAISICIKQDNPAIETAGRLIQLAKEMNIVISALEALINKKLLACLNKTKNIFGHEFPSPDILSIRQLLQLAKENKISIILDVNPVISTCLSLIKKIGTQDTPCPDLEVTQQLIDLANEYKIDVKLNIGKLTDDFSTLLTSIQADHLANQKEILETAQNLMQFLIKNKIKIPLSSAVIDKAITFLFNKTKTKGNKILPDPDLKTAELLIASTKIKAMNINLDGLTQSWSEAISICLTLKDVRSYSGKTHHLPETETAQAMLLFAKKYNISVDVSKLTQEWAETLLGLLNKTQWEKISAPTDALSTVLFFLERLAGRGWQEVATPDLARAQQLINLAKTGLIPTNKTDFAKSLSAYIIQVEQSDLSFGLNQTAGQAVKNFILFLEDNDLYLDREKNILLEVSSV